MKRILIALVLIASAFAWGNPAWPEVLDARYTYLECNAQFAKEFVELREACAKEHGVPIFNSSGYIQKMDGNLAILRDAADNDRRVQFGLTQAALGGNMLELGLKVVGDAFQNKSSGFFGCVQEGKEMPEENLEQCRAGALEKAETAATNFLDNDLGSAESAIYLLEAQGVDASGMKEVVEQGKELRTDIPAAFEEDNPAEARKLTLRHSRLLALFHLERMSATCKYALPILEGGSYSESLIEEVESLDGELEELLSECAYSSAVDAPVMYSSKNNYCWAGTWKAHGKFTSLKMKIFSGG